MEQEKAVEATPRALVESYLEAVKEHDLARCLEFYADDAALHYMGGVFKGKEAIAGWHQDRFDAEFQFVEVSKIVANGDKVVVDAAVTTKKIKAWKIGKLAGKATFQMQEGKIKEVKFSPRMYNPFEGW